MKKYLFALAAGFAVNSHAQLEPEQLDSLKRIWTAELKQEIIEKGIGNEDVQGWSEFSDSVYNAYKKDTFLLNGIFSRQLEVDQTTYGMVRANMEREEGYDKLLNHYYKLLLKKLVNEADKKILKQSQRNWIAFRDSEKNLSSMLTEERYSGGGTIQHIIYSDWSAQLTRRRVEELVDYLTRLVE